MFVQTTGAKKGSDEVNGAMRSRTKEQMSVSSTSEEDTSKPFVPTKIMWNVVPIFIVLHIGAIFGLYLVFISAMWKTILFAVFLHATSLVGVVAGVHRLWCHRSYKAKLPLRILLAFWSTISYQLSIYWWARDHRLHHKFCGTNADPYTASRGFFFSHMGWLMVRKHPEVIAKGKLLDMSDVLADPVVRFQRKHYWVLLALCCFVLPTITPIMLWGENFYNSHFVAVYLRLACGLHITFAINSAAHMWGNRPYNRHDESRENVIVTLGGIGEGFHNFHHTFPWDYAASEFGMRFNLSTAFINLMACFGQAYDLKTASPEHIENRKQRTGDGTHHKTMIHPQI